MFFHQLQIETPKGIKLHLQIREMAHPSWLICVHGIGEHSGRYAFLKELFPQGPNLCLFDLRGHGRSGGEIGGSSSLEEFSQDLIFVIQYMKKNYRMDTFTLLGHSMGGLIVADFLRNCKKHQLCPQKVFFSSPCVLPYGKLSEILAKLPILTTKIRRIPLTKLKVPLKLFVQSNGLSHDPRVIEDYDNDPLNIKKFSLNFLLGFGDFCKKIWSTSFDLENTEMAAIIGDQDHIVSLKAFNHFFDQFANYANVKIVQGGFHELHHETIRYRKQFMEFLYEFVLEKTLNHKVKLTIKD